MSRLLFPARRDAFVYYGPGEPIRQSGEVGLYVYTDPECTTLAYILDTDHVQVPGSLVFIGPDGLIPNFYGPDGVYEVYAKGTETDVWRLDADFASRLDDAIQGATQLVDYVDEQIATRTTPGEVANSVAALRTEIYGGTVDQALNTIKELGDMLTAEDGLLGALMTQVALKIASSEKGAAHGVAPLDTDALVAQAFLPTYLRQTTMQEWLDQALSGFTKIRTYATEQAAHNGLIANEFGEGDLVVVMAP